MLHGARLLCSVAAAFARLLLARALSFVVMTSSSSSLCSPRSSSPAAWLPPPARATAGPAKKARSAVVVVDEKPPAAGGGKDHHHIQLLQVSAPAVVVVQLPAALGSGKQQARQGAPARGRPPRLVIPPPVACAAGADPFGEAAGRETDVATTEVEVQGEGFCLARRRGVRHAMEDGYGVIADHITEGGSKLAFYGVYDGHGGRAAVDLVVDRLGKNVVAAAATAVSRREEEEEAAAVVAAIRRAYLSTDGELLSQGVRGGACAATALVKDGELYVANVGDCRAVLGSRGGVATALTTDHTPSRDDERRRIETSGGYVSCGGGGVWRVQDCLAVSRAFGDASMKPWVTCDPEVSRRRLTPDCRFLVLASDGLWDKVSCQEAVDAVHAASSASSTSVGSCKDLVAMARNRGSRDDITVMVVDLHAHALVPATTTADNGRKDYS